MIVDVDAMISLIRDFVVTSNDGTKDNGMIVNTVTQVANSPDKISVSINKLNYSHDVIKKTGKMNVNILSTDAPFAVFQKFGFQSGKDVNKFEGETTTQYIGKILEKSNVKLSRLSYGLPVGAELDYLDSLTLERAFEDRKDIA